MDRKTREDLPSVHSGPTKTIVLGASDGRSEVRKEGPDGRSAWIVAIACCIINFIMAGLGRMSGILFVAFIETYGVDRKSAAMPFSVRSSTRNLLGPVVGILGQKFGARKITVLGGIIGALSATSCFFAPDITWISILWGGLNGVGSALTVTLPQVVIGQYFDKHRTTASGLAFSGGCFGSFIFPVVLEYLLHNYGIEGTFLLMAAIIMHTIPAAMILRRPPWLDDENDVKADLESAAVSKKVVLVNEGNAVSNENNGTFTVGGENFKRDLLRRSFRNSPDVQFLRQNSKLVVKMLGMKSLENLSVSLEICRNEPITDLEACMLEELDEMLCCIEYSKEKSQFYQNLRMAKQGFFLDMVQKDDIKSVCSNKCSSFHLNVNFKPGMTQTNSMPDFSKVYKEISSDYVMLKLKELLGMNVGQVSSRFPNENKRRIAKTLKELRRLYNKCSVLEDQTSTQDVKLDDADSKKRDCSNGYMVHVKNAIKLHTNPLFLLVCLCRAVHFVTFIPVMTTVVDFIIDKGLKESDGKYAIAALSMGDLIGRLCFGWVTDRGYVRLSKYMMVVMVIQGASTASLPLMHSKVALFLTLAVFGMLQGSLFVRHPVLVSTYMGKHEQSIAMGCINFFSGILGFGLPIYIGYFRDTIGSYDYIFYINGAMGALVGLLWGLEPYFRRRSSPEQNAEGDSPEAV